jgi:hypothetical protein
MTILSRFSQRYHSSAAVRLQDFAGQNVASAQNAR